MKNLRKILIQETKDKIKKSFDKESLLIESSRFIKELDKVLDNLHSRLNNWYKYYNHKDDVLKEFSKSDLGADITKNDLNIIDINKNLIKNMIEVREKNFNYLKNLMEKKAPRLTEVAGVELGAILIDQANGLKKLAQMSSSKIQLLGAEKALFRHLKEGTKSPKYGLIYFHSDIQNAENKGKVARKLASEISKAVRIDYFRK